jgi:hypothetical protein
MECRLQLYCRDKTDMVAFHRLSGLPDEQEGRVSDTVSLFAEEYYTGLLVFSGLERRIIGAELFLGEDLIASAGAELGPASRDQTAELCFQDRESRRGNRPFLLYYDLVKLSLKVYFDTAENLPPGVNRDEPFASFASDYLLCLSKSTVTAENVEAIIKYLSEFSDDTVNEWMYSAKSRTEEDPGGLRGLKRNTSYKSLQAYMELLTSIYRCYEENYASFKSNVCHKIGKEDFMQPYSKIRSINVHSLQWLYRNTAKLAEVPQVTAIQLYDKYYLPYQMNIEKPVKSFDMYENRVVLGFLLVVYKHAKRIGEELRKGIRDEDQVIRKLREMERSEFHAPIIGVKEMRMRNNQALLNSLSSLISGLGSQYSKYREILKCSSQELTGIPKKTKIFQEVRPYRQVFEELIAWFRFGEFALLKENLFFNIKTMDKVFEYYCLCKLLVMLKDAGFTGSKDRPSFTYEYHPGGDYFVNEYDVANTYILRRGNMTLTLYYQPVINADKFENSISLYRTTSGNSYYTPDFLFKLQAGAGFPPYYVILDAKYAARNIIKEHHIKEAIIKYSSELADSLQGHAIKMVWLLQGRIDNAPDLERYHNSPLARKYKPDVSYGIVSVNTKADGLPKLWTEITNFLPVFLPAAPRAAP